MKSARPFLMFQGQAMEALDYYLSVFPEISVDDEVRNPDSSFSRATVRLRDLEIMVFDSPPVHDFGFTPSWSLFVECDDEAEIDRASAMLATEGMILMPLGAYDFSRRFAWVQDRFGVSWQLNLS